MSNGLISFTSNAGSNGMGLFVANEDGSGFRQLTVNAEVDAHSSRNYDGSRVVFSRSVNGNFDIWSMNADGTGLVKLTNDPAFDMVPTFSPDGKRIVFSKRSGKWRISNL